MTKANKQVAPGTLEVVLTFLNTWWIPNDTREPTDELVSLEAMRQFYSTWFGKAMLHEAIDMLPRLPDGWDEAKIAETFAISRRSVMSTGVALPGSSRRAMLAGNLSSSIR